LRPFPACSRLLLSAALCTLAAIAFVAPASADSSSEYHEVTRFGGFALAPGEFVEPAGFAVDAQEDEVKEDDSVIYVADRTNDMTSSPGEWRIQQLSSTGAVLGTTTFSLSSTSSIAGLAVDHQAGRLYALVVGPVNSANPYHVHATQAQELLAWSITPNPCVGKCGPTGGELVAAPGLGSDPLHTTGALIGSEAQLDAGATPLYDPQGIVVDRLEVPNVDNPVAIEATDLSGSTSNNSQLGGVGAYEFERNGNTIVQQVATQGSIGGLLAKWSAGELQGVDGGPRGILDNADGSISVLLYASEQNAYVVRLSARLGEPLVLDADEPANASQAIMHLDLGPFFTDPGNSFNETRNAGPEVAELSNGLYAADFFLPTPPFPPAPYWRSDEKAANIGVRLLKPEPGGSISNSRGETLVNTLGDATSPCEIGAEEASLAAGAGGTLWILDRGATSKRLEEFENLQSGREIIELAPGPGSPQERCPQPSGTFTMGLTCGSSQSGEEPLTVPAGAEVAFDASSVNLQHGTAFTYEWDFGDGDTVSGAKASETHVFVQPGTYTVHLKLLSDYGAYTPPPATVIVTPAEGLTPHAQFTITSPAGAQQATFDASGSTPGTCKTIADYLWNWGDGSPTESDGPQTPVLAHTYANPGSYAVTLTVVNSDFQSAVSAPQTVTVAVSPAEQSAFTESLPPAAGPLPAVPPPPDRSPTRLFPHASSVGSALDVSVSCPATKASCAGTVRVETVEAFSAAAARSAKATPRASRLVIGAASFSLAGGGRKIVSVRLTSRGMALLRRLRRLPVLVTVAAHDSFGDPGATTVRLTLDAPRVSLHGTGKRRSR
jgi:PKD domain